MEINFLSFRRISAMANASPKDICAVIQWLHESLDTITMLGCSRKFATSSLFNDRREVIVFLPTMLTGFRVLYERSGASESRRFHSDSID